MNGRVNLTKSVFVKTSFVLSLLILIFISSVSYKNITSLNETSGLLAHSYNVQIQLEQLLAYLEDAETGQRGYLITDDTIFLQPYDSALIRIKEPYLILQNLIAKNRQQQNHLNEIANQINLRMELLERSVLLKSLQINNKNLMDQNMIRGQQVMDTIRSEIDKMIHLEKMSLEEKQKKYKNEISFSPFFTFALFLFSLVVFIISFIKINNDLVKLKTTNENLLITTESFKHAEEIGELGSWQWDLDSNKLTYSDNLFRLVGSEPQSFESTNEKLIEFVHPDDRHIISDGVKLALEEKKASNTFYRIIRKDGKLRYFKSVSKITDLYGKKILIGKIIDVTEQHLINLELEARNKELEQSNKELASFNHIASHDLQEPLRKIHIFISRILEREILTLTDSGKEYFTKIQQSVNRMRLLIDDLLLYSRTNKTDKIFEKTDLNLLLEDATLELTQVIEEKNAVIKSTQLPVIKVIPFQIKQLFVNLIGNSLKYSKPDVSPVITIDCEKIITVELPLLNTNGNKKYYKISITDNGLGFEQQFAEKIFVLFYRLHQNSDYPGTGIGLSICKKIAENHNGYITAQGKPDFGAVFTVFLPG